MKSRIISKEEICIEIEPKMLRKRKKDPQRELLENIYKRPQIVNWI